ncbi:hypothetical protein D3C80_1842160 [compost metagenome]
MQPGRECPARHQTRDQAPARREDVDDRAAIFVFLGKFVGDELSVGDRAAVIGVLFAGLIAARHAGRMDMVHVAGHGPPLLSDLHGLSMLLASTTDGGGMSETRDDGIL